MIKSSLSNNNKMFDLNDDVMISVKTNYNHSGTSEYYLVVDDDDSVSYSAHNASNKDDSDVSLITRQLFPVDNDEVNELGSGGGVMMTSSNGLMTSPNGLMTSPNGWRADWLNLKVPVSVKPRKSRRGPPSRSSQYRGVTFYRRTGRWESHIWDCGKQLYLGGFDTSHDAARAYDRAAIKFRGTDTDINFELSDYDEDMAMVKNLSKEDFIHVLRRQSNGFSRGSSKYRGVTLHKCGRWEARIGQQLLGKKAYDKAAIKCNGTEAITNFEPSTYGAYKNLEGRDEASGHNLDLSLWVSPTKDGPKHSHVQSVDMGFTARDLPSRKRPKVGGFAPAMGGHPYHDPTAAQHLPAWTGMYFGHNPSYEATLYNFHMEMTAGMGSGSVVPSPGVSNAVWQMKMAIGHHAVPIPVTSNAASSGFASSFTKYMDPLFLSNRSMQNKTSTHDTFNPMPMGTSSQY